MLDLIAWRARAERCGPVLSLALMIALAAWVDRSTLRDLLRADFQPGDLQVVCATIGPILDGLDPYPVGNIAGTPYGFPYPYLYHVALLAAPLCVAPWPGLHMWLYLALLTGSVALMARGLGCRWRDAVLLALIAPAVFDAMRWIMMTGNVAALEVPFAAAMVVAFRRGAYALAAALLATVASFKLLPIVGLVAFLLVLPLRHAVRAIAAGCAALLAILGANLAVMGSAAPSFFRQLVGGIPGQHSPWAEVGLAWVDPNLIAFASALAEAAGLTHRTLAITPLLLGALLLGAALMALRPRADRQPWLRMRLFCLAVLIVNLLLFRLKPYGFAALVPLALACAITPRGRVSLPLAAAAAVPALAILNGPPTALQPYYQLISLLVMVAAGLLALAREARAQRRPAAAEKAEGPRLVAAAE